MNKEGTVVDNNFCTLFICNSRENLALRRLTEKRESNTLSFL